MKSMQRDRSQVTPPGSKGFTLIELMVVITILAIVAAIAVGAIRQDRFAGSYKRFIDDLNGKITEGRNFAIDQQTRVRLDFYANRVEARTYDQALDQWIAFGQKRVDDVDAGLLNDGGVCLHGLMSGAVPPAEAQNLAGLSPPAACLAGFQQLFFEADGTFTVADNVLALQNQGATLWVGDHTMPGQTKLSMIQLFPGGLMRTFEYAN